MASYIQVKPLVVDGRTYSMQPAPGNAIVETVKTGMGVGLLALLIGGGAMLTIKLLK